MDPRAACSPEGGAEPVPTLPPPAHYPRNVPHPALSTRLGAGIFAGTLLACGIAGAPAQGAAAPPSRASTAAAEDPTDLRLTIRRLTPGTLPARGPVRIRGTLTNTGEDTWTGISIFPFVGDQPMTTTTEIIAAAATEPTAVVGQRITEVVHTVESLEPGDSVRYSLRIPRRLIDIEDAGVYWFGAHALAASPTSPQDNVADARARTFLPHLPDPEGEIDTAIVIALRQQIGHTTQGAVADVGTWRAALTDGTLRASLDFGAAAAGRPVTWVLDPALPDRLRQLMVGNPIRSVAPTIVPEGQEDEAEDPATSDLAVADTTVARAAQAWLEDAESTLRDGDLMLLPYGDLDVAAAGEHAPELYDVARDRSGNLVEEWGIATSPVVASPSGYLDEDGLAVVDDGALVLLTDRMFTDDEYADGAPTVVDLDGRRAVVASYEASTGGPGPNARRAPVALRQRVLAEAAARLLSAPDGAEPAPLVMQLPAGVRAHNADRFWEGLDQPWLNLTTASDAASHDAVAVDMAELTYPESQEAAELDFAAFAEVERIREQAPVLQRLYTLNQTVGDRLVDEALAGLGYTHRVDEEQTIEWLADIQEWTQHRLEGVSIAALPGVTLSSDSGGFAVTLRNRLDEPVTVGVRGDSDGAFIDPVEPVVVPADGHATIPLTAHVQGTGVHNLVIELTDGEGTPLGVESTVPIRSGQVGAVIWWIIGAGGGILAVAIALRVVRRIRRVSTSSTTDDPLQADDSDSAEVGTAAEDES